MAKTTDPPRGLLEHMRQLIAGGEFPPGSRLPPTRALATRLQVSRATIGEMLRQLESEGAIIAGSERIRFVAGGARTSSEPLRPLPGGTVAILSGLPLDYPSATTFPFVHRIHAALSRSLLAAGRNPFLMVGGADQSRRAAGLRPSACVVLDDAFGPTPDHRTFLAPLLERGIHVVVQSDRISEADAGLVDCVRCDHRTGSAELTRLLAGRGRRRLVATFPELPDAAPYWTAARERGMREAAAELGLPTPEVLRLPRLDDVADDSLRFHRHARMAAGFLLEALRGPDAADALLIASDGEVAPVAAACRLLGRQPGADIDLVGYDDYWRGIPEMRYEGYRPEATVDRDGSAVGTTLAAVVAERLAVPARRERLLRLVPQRLVVGEAVGAPRPFDDEPPRN